MTNGPACRYCGNTNKGELVMDWTIGQMPLVMCRRICVFDWHPPSG